MIELYSGTPGSGKSLHCAERIYWRLRQGQPVIANFPIEPGYIKGYKNTFYEVNNKELNPGCFMNSLKPTLPNGEILSKKKQFYLLLMNHNCSLMLVRGTLEIGQDGFPFYATS